MKYRWMTIAVAAAFVWSGSLFAQAARNEIGVWVGQPSFGSTRFADPADEFDFEIGFEDENSLAVTFAHHFTNHFATEFGLHRMVGDAEVRLGGFGETIALGIGDADLTVLSAIAQWKFMPESRFVPYLGGGAAYVTGELDIADDLEDPELGAIDTDFEAEVSLIVNGGVEFSITPAVGLALDAKYFPYNAAAKDDPLDPGIDLDPLVLSLGVKWRF